MNSKKETNMEKGIKYENYINILLNIENIAWKWNDIPENDLRNAEILGDWNEYRYNRKLLKLENIKTNNLIDLGCDILLKKDNKYYLTHCRFRKYNYREAERIIQYLQSTSKIEIAECIYLPSKHCVSILKTIWLRLIQRRWKKIINERKLIIKKRCNPNSIKYREIHGIWPDNCFIYPILKGMLSNLYII